MRNEVDPWRENVNWATDAPGGGYPRRHLLTPAVGVERDGIVYELFGNHAFLSASFSLLPAEQRVFALTQPILHLLANPSLYTQVRDIRISETMRMDYRGEEVLGVWEPGEHRIVIRRDQLRNVEHYAATLLHEATHALTGADDGSFAFEQGLTFHLGKVAAQAIGMPSNS